MIALKFRSTQKNQSLNNYVETILCEIIFDVTNYLLKEKENKKRKMEGMEQYAEGKTQKN